MNITNHPASFRDPDGAILFIDNVLHRFVSNNFKSKYDKLMNSGLHKELVKNQFIVDHEENGEREGGFLIKPELISNISYPYEWSFSQLKDAALLTLKIQEVAIEHGMSLKDASAYNIQFQNGKPIFIDTTSFENFSEGQAWVAYKQFCQHFLAPLALMSCTDIRLGSLLKNYIDGIPLDLAASLMPLKSKLSLGLSMHLFFHAKMQGKYSDSGISKQEVKKIPKMQTLGILDSLKTTISKLKLSTVDTEWGDYYNNTNYSDESFNEKKELIKSFSKELKLKKVWDLGANRGVFSRIFADQGINTIAWDIDPIAVEKNYNQIKKSSETSISPLLVDLTNPTPSIGWSLVERDSFVERAKDVDLVMALALIHHLAIGNNVPLEQIAMFFSKLSENLIIEFVPKGDSQVDILLSSREDIFSDYNESGFEKAFSEYYTVEKKENVQGSKRTLYLLKKK